MLDSTPVHDAVATQDTLTQLRSAIRKLLRALDQDHRDLAAGVRTALRRDDDYAGPGKPPCDWDDAEAKQSLIDALVLDARAALGVVEGQALSRPAAEAAELLALVAGGWRPTAPSPPWTPRPATATRATAAASTATRPT